MPTLVADEGDGRIYELDSRDSNLIHVAHKLGLGVRKDRGRTKSGTRHCYRTRLSQAELDEVLERQGEVFAATKAAPDRIARRADSPKRPLYERMVEAWRQECAEPAPGREDPRDCWRYVCRSYDMPLLPMPRETPPARIVRHAEDYARSGEVAGFAVRVGRGE
jgi:hypothetical protein